MLQKRNLWRRFGLDRYHGLGDRSQHVRRKRIPDLYNQELQVTRVSTSKRRNEMDEVVQVVLGADSEIG